MSVKIRFCEVCKKQIKPERLEAEPKTLLCEEHARKIEKYGGEFIRTVTQERTSKAGSIKQGYGSAEIHKARNHEALEKLKDEYAAVQK